MLLQTELLVRLASCRYSLNAEKGAWQGGSAGSLGLPGGGMGQAKSPALQTLYPSLFCTKGLALPQDPLGYL